MSSHLPTSRLPMGSATRMKRPANTDKENQGGPLKAVRLDVEGGGGSNVRHSPRLAAKATARVAPITRQPTTTAARQTIQKAKRKSISTLNKKTAATTSSAVIRPQNGRQSTLRPMGHTMQRSTSTIANRRVQAGKPASEPAITAAKPRVPTASTAAPKPRRPAWDVKGRVMDLEDDNRKMRELMERMTNKLESTEKEKTEVEEKAKVEVAKVEEVSTAAKELRDKLQAAESSVSHLTTLKDRLQTELDASQRELMTVRAEVEAFRATIAQLTAQNSCTDAKLRASETQLELAKNTITVRDSLIASLESENASHIQTIEGQTKRIQEHETLRRKLHNSIQELKGNIRVFCRVRPLLAAERQSPSLPDDSLLPHIVIPADDPDQRTIELVKSDCKSAESSDSGFNSSRLPASGRQSNYEFQFDRIFGPESGQVEIFDEISQLVQSALDGYNVCIFAYGQTGSGKTFTMEGPGLSEVREKPHLAGMIPLSVKQIFESAEELKSRGWNYTFEASFVEIYNESVRDLLSSDTDAKLDIKMIEGSKGQKDVDVAGLTVEPVENQAMVDRLLTIAARNRAVAATRCNDRSSRSHSVFRLKLSARNYQTGEKCEGMLNLVDLAGSERLKETGAVGDRLKETQSINKSLSMLGDVIVALANKNASGRKDAHVPYRNSKLTYLLQNSLGGNSKTLMFVNVSPREECFGETVNSLRFATKVNQCNIGTATKKMSVK